MPVLCWFLVPVREGAPPRDKELLLEAGLEEASEGALERKDIVWWCVYGVFGLGVYAYVYIGVVQRWFATFNVLVRCQNLKTARHRDEL